MGDVDWPIGPFLVERLLGRGGMGEVWRGRHAATGTAVALKVVTRRFARKAAYQASFRREVRAMAALAHPNVCAIYDHGVIAEDTAARSGGRLVEGCPWLAMELADGSVETLRGRVGWPELRRLLIEVLDGLAHAHARGMVHRDIKPANVLVLDGGARITDFGVTHWGLEVTDERLVSPGTPAFMAPEQIAGTWRDLGPPTDLFALGCTAWTLATGHLWPRPPRRTDGPDGRDDTSPPQPFLPRRSMPEALEGWLLRLLAEDPLERYPSAAAARSALERLPETPMREPAPSHGAAPKTSASTLVPASIWANHSTLLASGVERTVDEAPAGAPLAPRSWATPLPLAPPPLPQSWRVTRERRGMRLSGVGLGLYGLRHLPLIGRDELQDELWEALCTVSLGEGPRGALLRGEAGVGKSRLARWLGQTALELGVAELLWVRHERASGAGDGLVAALQRHLRTDGLARPDMAAHLDRLLGPLDPRALGTITELLHPLGRDELPQGVLRVDLKTPEARRAAMSEAIGILARRRPLVLWLDDLQWARETLEVAEALLDGPTDAPILLVATVRDEALEELSEVAVRLDALVARPRMRSLPVAPLSPARRVALVEELLGLSGPLAHQVAERTGGNPLFATQLVGDWVERGILVAGEGGFALAEGALVPIPDAIHTLWVSRLERALEGRAEEGRRGLELAAVFGVEVGHNEWRAACEVAGLAPDLGLLDRMFGLGLAQQRPTGWAFVHGMLAESVSRRAEEAGRLPAAKRAVGESLVVSGERSRTHDQWPTALRVFARAEGLLDPRSDPRTWIRARLGRIGTAVSLADWAEMTPLIEETLRFCEVQGMRHEEVVALVAIGRQAHFQGRSDDALRALERARACGGDDLDPRVAASIHSELTALFRARGAPAAAVEHGRAALELYRRVGDTRGECTTLSRLGYALLESGSDAEGRAAFRQGLEIAERHGYPESRANLQASLGALAGLEGRFDEAESSLLAALEVERALQHRRGLADTLCNLANTYAAWGRDQLAEQHFELAMVAQREVGGLVSEAHTLMLFGLWLINMGRAAEATDRLDAARWQFEAFHAPHRRDIATGYYWVARAMQGELDEARAGVTALLDQQARPTLLLPAVNLQCCAARIEALAGDWRSARAHVELARQAALGAGQVPGDHIFVPIEKARERVEAAARAAQERSGDGPVRSDPRPFEP